MFRVERINKMTIRIFRLTGLVAVGLVAAGLGSAADLQSMTGIARRDVYRDSQTTTTGIAVSVSVPTSQAVPLEGQNLRQSDTALAEQLRAGLRAVQAAPSATMTSTVIQAIVNTWRRTTRRSKSGAAGAAVVAI